MDNWPGRGRAPADQLHDGPPGERMTDIESYQQRRDDASAGRALEAAFTQLPTLDVYWHKTIQAMTWIVCGYEKLCVGV